MAPALFLLRRKTFRMADTLLDVAQQFHEIFAGNARAYGIYNVNSEQDNGKKVGPAATKPGVTTAEMWARHLSGKQGLGIIPIRDDDSCMFGAIDVDQYTDTEHRSIAARLMRLGIPLIVCRSKSGGAHLYCFTAVPVTATKMQTKLREVASVLGYGGCEIFPKQTHLLSEEGDVGQWINMPYFGGVRGMRYAVDTEGNALSPEAFTFAARQLACAPAWFDSPTILVEDFPDGPPCLQILSKLGYPPGTRNDGLYNIGVFLKKSDPDNWEAQLDVMNHKFMLPPLALTEVQGVAKSLKRKEYNYTCTKQPICNHCNATLCRTRKHGIGGGQGKFPSLGGLTKLNTRPPIWFWTVDGVRMELQTQDLQDPRFFQKRCMDVLNQMPGVPSNAVWQAAVQHAMDGVTIVEAPNEASSEGQFWEMAESFCTGRAQASVKEEICLRKPFSENGRTYFRLADLVAYLQNQRFTDFRTNKIASILKENGAEHHSSNFKGKSVNYWSIKSFGTRTEGYGIPNSVAEGDSAF